MVLLMSDVFTPGWSQHRRAHTPREICLIGQQCVVTIAGAAAAALALAPRLLRRAARWRDRLLGRAFVGCRVRARRAAFH